MQKKYIYTLEITNDTEYLNTRRDEKNIAGISLPRLADVFFHNQLFQPFHEY